MDTHRIYDFGFAVFDDNAWYFCEIFPKICKKIKGVVMIGIIAVIFTFIAFFGSLMYVARAVGND